MSSPLKAARHAQASRGFESHPSALALGFPFSKRNLRVRGGRFQVLRMR